MTSTNCFYYLGLCCVCAYFLHVTPVYVQGWVYARGAMDMVRAAHRQSICACSWAFSSIFFC